MACYKDCNAVAETFVAELETNAQGAGADDKSAQRPLHHNTDALDKRSDARTLMEQEIVEHATVGTRNWTGKEYCRSCLGCVPPRRTRYKCVSSTSCSERA